MRIACFSIVLMCFATPVAAQDESVESEPVEGQAPAAEDEAEEETGYHVVVLSVGGDAPEGVAREAREAVAAALAQDGLRVLPEGDLALRFPPSRLRGCDSAACAWALGRELGVSMVAAVATWQGDGRAASITVSLVVGERRAHAASEDVGERSIPETAAAAVRGAQDARARALIVEGSAGAEPEPDSSESDERDSNAPVVEEQRARERSLEEYVLPGVLGAVGLALAASAVYALMPEDCAVVGASGICLRGDAPNIGLGVVFAITGGLSIAGAIIWLVVGGMPSGMDRIDVVLGPDGGGVGWRGTF